MTDVSSAAVRFWARLRGLGLSLWHDPVARCRAWVVAASIFVCAYAVGVLAYVLATPELGIRCAFTPVVNHFFDEFLYPDDQAPLEAGDEIVEVGGHRVTNWPQLLRRMRQLSRQE